MRVANWPFMLNAALSDAALRPFAWGEFDCFIWAHWAIEIYTRENKAKEYCGERGLTLDPRPYMTTKGMLRTLHGLGFEDFYDLICAIHGEPIDVTLAQRGDLVMIDLPDAPMPALGICRGIDAMFKTREKNIYPLLAECRCAWRIA